MAAVIASLDPLVELGDRPQGPLTDTLDLTVDKDMGRLVQVLEETFTQNAGFKAENGARIGQEGSDGCFARIEQLQADRYIGRERGQPPQGGRTLAAGNTVSILAFQQAENLVEETGHEFGGILQVFQSGGFQALPKTIEPVAEDGDLMEADARWQIDLHARNIREGIRPSFAPIV